MKCRTVFRGVPLPVGAALLVISSVTALAATQVTGGAQFTTAAGGNSPGFSGDGGPATAAQLSGANGVASMPDGGFLIADRSNQRIRKVSPSGVISTVAGNGVSGFSGDGGAATAAQLSSPNAVAVRADGSFLIADTGNGRIRQVTPAGTIVTVAGSGKVLPPPSVGDGGPAPAATLNNPSDVAVTADGGFLIADSADWRIRKVGVNGIITTVAGTGVVGFSGDGGPATSAQLNAPGGVAATADGGFLIGDSENDRVRKVSAGGVITTAAGSGATGFTGDGGAATSAQFNHPSGVAATPDGGFYVADTFNGRVRFVSATGTITTVAGGRSAGGYGEGEAPTNGRLNYPYGISLTPNGYLISDGGANVIRRVAIVAAKVTVKVTTPTKCVSGNFTARVRVTSVLALKKVVVLLDGHTLTQASRTSFAVRVKAKALKKGRHVLRADATDSTGKRASVKRNFKRC